MSIIFHGVQPEELEKVFPLVTPWLSSIPLLLDQYRLQDVYIELEDGAWQLWIMVDKTVIGAVLTEIMQYPLRRELVIKGISGSRMHEWKAFIVNLEDYGRANGCDKIITAGARHGWRKIVPDYKSDRVILEKKL